MCFNIHYNFGFKFCVGMAIGTAFKRVMTKVNSNIIFVSNSRRRLFIIYKYKSKFKAEYVLLKNTRDEKKLVKN